MTKHKTHGHTHGHGHGHGHSHGHAHSDSAKKSLFPIKASADSMLAYIPENTKLSSALSALSYDDFCTFLAGSGYGIKPKIETFNEFIKLCSTKEPYIENAFPLIKGRPFMPPRDAIIKWLNEPNIPHDLVFGSIPFAILHQARGSVASKNVYGVLTPLSQEQQQLAPGTPTTLHPSLSVNPKGEITSQKPGQVILDSHKLDFKELYTVTSLRAENIQKVTFPCNVLVNCELEGPIEWTVHGNLTVEEYWTSNKIKVTGDVCAKGGIQTNFPNDEQNAITIQGNLDANFIQSSTFIIEGKVKVDKAITNSLLIVNGESVECLGDPGRILGSEVALKKGSVFAKGVGGEKDKSAYIKFLTEEGANNSKIEAVAEGTRMQIRKSSIIVKFTQPWPPK